MRSFKEFLKDLGEYNTAGEVDAVNNADLKKRDSPRWRFSKKQKSYIKSKYVSSS